MTKWQQIQNIQVFSHVTFVDKLLFTKHVSVMLKSGISLSETLETLVAQTKSDAFKNVLTHIVKDIRNGQQLAQALSKYPKIFDNFYISLIEVGEESGKLEENLEYLAVQLAKEFELRKKIQNALLYPTIVLTAIVIVGTAMSIFVLPQLVNLFSSMDIKLPLSTQILLFFAKAMKDHGIIIVPSFFASIIGLHIFLSLSVVKPFKDRVVLRIPIYGSFLQNEQMATLCRNLGTMLKSGLTIKTALGIQSKVSTNTVFKEYLLKIQKSITRGKGIEDELSSGKYPYVSLLAVKMIGVGEKTGKLDETLLYLGDFFDNEVDSAAKNLSVVLEPLILLIIGLLVAFVAVAIITPIYQFTGSVKR